jgi:molecular chaperone DnaJ
LSKRDYYEVLGVDRGVDEGVLKTAYRKLALEFHPDRNPDDPAAEERFKEISEAYAVLSDPDKRSRYDRFGHQGVAAGGPSGADFGDLGGFTDLFNDLFGDIFGGGGRGFGGRGRGRGSRGADLRYNLEIGLDEVLTGSEASIKIPKMRVCEGCSGSGARAGSAAKTCERCRGAGQIAFQQGFFRVNRPCDVCGGAGEVISDPCGDCRGSGRTEGQQTISVKVPAGVDDGARLRLVGEGEAGIAGGPPGDLYIVILVRKHPLFERDGRDLHCEVPVPFVQAVLGGEIEAPSLEGRITVRVPEGTQSGKILRLQGKGLPPLQPRMDPSQLERMRGDIYVRIFVEVPTRLTERQRELLEEFADESGTEVSPVTRGFLDKLRELFE